jgi:hypothetical protein
MDPALTEEIIAILDDANDMTIATVREDGYPQATKGKRFAICRSAAGRSLLPTHKRWTRYAG